MRKCFEFGSSEFETLEQAKDELERLAKEIAEEVTPEYERNCSAKHVLKILEKYLYF